VNGILRGPPIARTPVGREKSHKTVRVYCTNEEPLLTQELNPLFSWEGLYSEGLLRRSLALMSWLNRPSEKGARPVKSCRRG